MLLRPVTARLVAALVLFRLVAARLVAALVLLRLVAARPVAALVLLRLVVAAAAAAVSGTSSSFARRYGDYSAVYASRDDACNRRKEEKFTTLPFTIPQDQTYSGYRHKCTQNSNLSTIHRH